VAILRIYNENGQLGEGSPQLKSSQLSLQSFEEIQSALRMHQVQLERWPTPAALSDSANQEDVLAAYSNEVQRLREQYQFQSVDVVSLGPDHPQKTEFRQKFIAEHRHADFEIRYFVDGTGLFYLHLGSQVFLLFCEKGDLISVPANTRHWFDMGAQPFFKCIRFFTTKDGWVGDFTGDEIAKSFPSYDEFRASLM